MFPPHLHYVEPYCGGCSVLLAKDPEGVSEVVNDINHKLTNFWNVLQSDAWFAKFKRKVEAIPFGEPSYYNSVLYNIFDDDLDIVDRAVNFFVVCRQSLAGRMKSFAPLSKNRVRRGMNEQASAWLTAIEGLPEVHNRLKRVVILNKNALEVIKQEDSPNTFFYLDPPYLHETRTSKDVYEFEMTKEDHVELAVFLYDIKGKAMISGYPSELYKNLYQNWNMKTFDLPNNSASGTKKRRMTEVIWFNY